MDKQAENEELDLLQILGLILSKWNLILKVTSGFLVVGGIIAFTARVEYESVCKLLPESQSAGLPSSGGLSGLAGLAGVNLSGLGANENVLTPELYPEILRSTPFLMELIERPIYFEKLDTTITSFHYLKELEPKSLIEVIRKYTLGIPWTIKEMFSESEESSEKLSLSRLSKEEWRVIQKFSEKISINVDKQTLLLTLKFEFSDPVAGATVLSLVVEELKLRIFEYKIEKAKENLQFINARFEEAKEAYNTAQVSVANFIDRNRNISNPIVEVQLEGLNNEMNIAFEVYSSLASELEQAKIKVQEDTPIFTILEPVRIPEDKSRPKRGIILILFTLAGLISGLSYVILRLNLDYKS